MKKVYKLIALDRDGVINEDSDDYIKSPDEWRAIVGSLEAIAKLNKFGYKVVVISNQSGIARGYFAEKDLQLIQDKMISELSKRGGFIDGVYYCPHHPNDNCECRKPKAKMLLQALRQFGFEPKDALMVGDAWVDVQLAKNVGCDFVLVQTGKGKKTFAEHGKELTNTPVFDNLAAMVEGNLM
jgi:D-glycero-D-manno-heptose 1,7-bisphosphate phosphatase